MSLSCLHCRKSIHATMECVMLGQNAKGKQFIADGCNDLIHLSIRSIVIFWNYSVLAKAIHSLARISNELYFEVDATKGLLLSAVNLAVTSFVSIQFKLDFFRALTAKSNPNENKWKLPMKTCVRAFRKLNERVSFVLGVQYNQYYTTHSYSIQSSLSKIGGEVQNNHRPRTLQANRPVSLWIRDNYHASPFHHRTGGLRRAKNSRPPAQYTFRQLWIVPKYNQQFQGQRRRIVDNCDQAWCVDSKLCGRIVCW